MAGEKRRILVTGANGFVGKNLVVRLNELPGFSVLTFVKGDDANHLPHLLAHADVVIHLAGENRPVNETAFTTVNVDLTTAVCDAIRHEHANSGRYIPLLLASSTQALQNNPYGKSKLAAEQALHKLANDTGNPCVIFRLPGVFGKWTKPNYNSVVATYCHNIARGHPITIHDAATQLRLVYIDDVVTAFIKAIEETRAGCVQATVEPEYQITLGELARQIQAFSDSHSTLTTDRVGTGLIRALYATYISYLPSEKFLYSVPQYADSRGVFVEMLKTQDSGQFSYFTSHPGVTRGGHYHHSKTEKFLVIKGEAHFRFRHLLTNEFVEIKTNGSTPQVVDTIPGWSHDITNVGKEEMVVMIWANEIFIRHLPDTVASKV
jgi:UDP-2-acetamido-2,6-beta-L-arabino-hexul-4-ose reductase